MSICNHYKQITHADYLRQDGPHALKTDEELADYMAREHGGDGEYYDLYYQKWLRWLKLPHEDAWDYEMED